MLFTQHYTARSTATVATDSLGLCVAAETGRPPVRLHATVRDSLAYARLMKTLYAIVCTNALTPPRDRTAYFAWVQERYLEELAEQQVATLARVPGWVEQRDMLRARLKDIHQRMRALYVTANSTDYYAAVRKYYTYLYTYDRDLWVTLDPVVSVHPDCLIFEAFSQDESTYGRITVPMDRLALHGPVDYGTTNIDFSPDLAREIGRIRSYRATDLHVGPLQVALATTAGSVVEKKIDLPPTWVRGFLQVQSAATLPGVDVRLSAATLADVLAVVRRRHEDRGPRSLRFQLTPGERHTVVVEPWGIIVQEGTHRYEGQRAQEIRVWGRRRLLVLEELLPYAEDVRVRLLGTGLPSYWSVQASTLRLDMGVSGWTQNDWSRAAQFDMLASLRQPSAGDRAAVAAALENCLQATPEQISATGEVGRETATGALQSLVREGRAMYDFTTGVYRWRQLFPVMPEPTETAEDARMATARRLVERKAVTWTAPPQKNPTTGGSATPAKADASGGWRTFSFKEGGSDKFWNILLTDTSHVVHFGRTGAAGQKQQKTFATAKETKVSYDKLVKEKTGKGYTETTPPPVPIAAPVTDNTIEPTGDRTRFTAAVKGEKVFNVVIDVDSDGRATYAQCTCSAYRRDKLRKGPCPHILATSVTAGQHLASTGVL